MTAPALLTEQQAAEALQICTRTLRKARQQGRLTYVLIGRAVRYTHSDLDRFIESSRQEQMPCPRPRPTRSIGKTAPGKIVPFSARQ